MSDNWNKDVTYGNKFQSVITDRLEKVGYKVIDTHKGHDLGYDIVITPLDGGPPTKVELKRQREIKHFFELNFKGAKSKWRGKTDQMWVWSDGNKSFEVYDAKVLETYLLKLKFEGHSFHCGDKDENYPSTCVELPFKCREAGWIKSYKLKP